MAALPVDKIDIEVPENAKQSAVVELLYPDASGEWHIIYIQRVSHKGDRHSGQIGFPGGKQEPEDGTLMDTAMRECHEEIGVTIQEKDIIGPMTPFYIPVSGFFVQPYLSIIDYTPRMTLQMSEVADVISHPVTHLIHPESAGTIDQQLTGGLTIKKVPYYDLNGRVLWGATAMFTSELVDLLRR